MRTLVLGLGNPIFTDDAIGWHVVEALRCRLREPEVEFATTSLAGLRLLDLMWGYDRVILIDAIKTSRRRVGEVYCLRPEDLPVSRDFVSVHSLDLVSAWETGRRFQWPLPREVLIFAVEVSDPCTLGEGLTLALAQQVPTIVETVLQRVLGGKEAPPDE